MSFIVDVNKVSNINRDENIYARLKTASEDGDVQRLYGLIAEDPYILDHFDKVPFCETPLHVAAEKGQTRFAMELMTLKPSLALKLNTSGFSPIHLALQNNHIRMVRKFVAFDNILVSIKGRGSITILHHIAQIGDAELLSEFLYACPSSLEDLTTEDETVVHVAVKNNHFMTFKVLLGWVKRENSVDILDWKNEDGNTVYHIAASTNQTKVMKLLCRIVNVKAKNLDGKTAMDILQTYKSPLFGKISGFLNCAKEKLLCGSTLTLGEYLSKKPSSIERRNCRLGLTNLSKFKRTSPNTDDNRGVILVVAILIATATYQTGFTPPGGFWQDDSEPNNGTMPTNGTSTPQKKSHTAGEMIMDINNAATFYIFNGIAFFSSLYVIMILITGLPRWKVLYGSILAMGVANFVSFSQTLPITSGFEKDEPYAALAGVLVAFAYPFITLCYIVPFVVAFYTNKHRRHRVDFPGSYFSKVK